MRVLAVDDSAVMRGVLRMLFLQHAERRGELPEMELCGIVEDGVECLAAVPRLRPDVVVLDLEMPRMHGLEVLERLRLEEPDLPVIMCSSYTKRGARSTLDALALGAADYVMKPSQQSNFTGAMETLANDLLPKIAALAGFGGLRQSASAGSGFRGLPVGLPGAPGAAVELVVVGVSTGGPSALEQMLPQLDKNFPVPVMIVQHMPKLFTGALAERLDRACALRVQEAYDGAEVHPGTIWLAPGDAHLEIARPGEGSGAGSRPAVARLHQQRSLNHCKPSADYLFDSAARSYGAGVLAVVMTGMGSDGLAGARHVHQAGGVVLVQDAASSAVWGMPGRVFEAGIAREPIPLSSLADEITLLSNAGRGGRRIPASPFGSGFVTRRRETTVAAEPRREVMHGLL